jgi:hypothetical protein
MALRRTTIASTLVLAAVTAGLCGCAENPFLSSGPDPRVEDCALVRQATPTEFYCGPSYGTCTAVQLSNIDEGKATSCKKTTASATPRVPRDTVRTDQHEPIVG